MLTIPAPTSEFERELIRGHQREGIAIAKGEWQVQGAQAQAGCQSS